MDAQTAQVVFYAIMTVGICVWCHSLVRALEIGASKVPPVDPWGDFEQEEPDDGGAETGARTLRGDPEMISRGLALTLLRTGLPGSFSSLFEVVERSARRVVIRKNGPLFCNQPPSLYFTEAEFTLMPVGEDAVEVGYHVSFGQLAQKTRRIALGIIFGIGLPVLLGVGWAVWSFCVNNPNPSLRWMVFQSLHIAHALWPPFLFIHLYKAGRKHSRTYVSNLLVSAELTKGVEALV